MYNDRNHNICQKKIIKDTFHLGKNTELDKQF